VPAATPADLRAQMAGGRLGPVYLLLGDDDRTVSRLIADLLGTLDQELLAFNCDRVYLTDKDVTPDSVLEAARLVPMMAPRRLVIVQRAEKWLKPRRPPTEPEDDDGAQPGETVDRSAFAPLLEYLKAPVPSTTLVVAAADANKTLALTKAFYKHATVVECWGLSDGSSDRAGDVVRHGLAFIRQAAAATGRAFEPGAAQMLAERSGGDIAKLRADVDHVLLFAEGKRAIARADVEAVVAAHETGRDPWAMVNAIERGQAGQALRLLAATLDAGEPPVRVLGQLAWWVREKLPQARPAQKPAATQAVFRTDLDLKSSGGDPRVLLERLVLELCALSGGGLRRALREP